MGKITFLSLVLISIIVSNCGNATKKDAVHSVQETPDTGTAKILFREYEHDFGRVAEGEKIGFVFTFENHGTGNLIIASATTTCGCTVPEYDAKPVVPGGAGNLEVFFDTSGRSGIQTKTITVKSNALTPVVLLKIKAEVVQHSNQ